MSETLVRCALLLLDTALPLAVGCVLRKRRLVSPAGTQAVITFNVRAVYTALAFISFWKVDFSLSMLWVVAMGLLITFTPFFLTMAATRGNTNPRERGAMVTSGMLGNTGTLGGLVSYLVMGPAAYAYVQTVGVLQNIILILFNFPVAARFRDMARQGRVPVPEKRHSFLKLFFTWNQLALVGMAAGSALSICAVPQPDWLPMVFSPLVHFQAWVGFLSVGLLMDLGRARRRINRTLGLVPLKLVLMPLVTWLACLAFGIDEPAMAGALIIVSACPTAINAVMTCALYSLDTDLAVSSFLTTTVLFLALLCPAFFLLLG